MMAQSICTHARTRKRAGHRAPCQYPATYMVWAESTPPTATTVCQYHLGQTIDAYATTGHHVHVSPARIAPSVAGQDSSGEYARGYARAVQIVSDALRAARAEPRPPDRATTERGGRITALGSVLNELMTERS